jgi:hypothetical protein
MDREAIPTIRGFWGLNCQVARNARVETEAVDNGNVSVR